MSKRIEPVLFITIGQKIIDLTVFKIQSCFLDAL